MVRRYSDDEDVSTSRKYWSICFKWEEENNYQITEQSKGRDKHKNRQEDEPVHWDHDLILIDILTHRKYPCWIANGTLKYFGSWTGEIIDEVFV